MTQQSRVDILEERVDAQAVSSQEQREDTRSFRAEVNSRFDASDSRMESRFDASDARMESRFNASDARMESRFNASDARIESIPCAR
jgi:hypothetical protein